VTGDEKWICFQNPKRKKSWVDPAQPSTSSSRPNRFGRKTVCVWWDQKVVIYYKLLNPGETVMLTATTNNWSNCIVLCVKKGRIIGKDMTWFFSTTTHHRTRQQWSKITQLRSATPSRLLTKPSDYHLFSSMGHAFAEQLRFFRRHLKMAWWVVCLERWGIFLAWYTQIAWKMGKMYS